MFVECRGADNSGFEHITDIYYGGRVSVCGPLIFLCSVVFLVTSEHFATFSTELSAGNIIPSP